MTDPPGIPPQAITAAAEAIERKLLTEPPGECMTWLEADEELARAALEAAAPHLAAAERERITGLFNEWIEVVLDAPYKHSPGAWMAAFTSLVDPDHPGKIAERAQP